jgi:hypothetical protein
VAAETGCGEVRKLGLYRREIDRQDGKGLVVFQSGKNGAGEFLDLMIGITSETEQDMEAFWRH